ncbi:MAG: glycosyltransferase family 2 protein [Lachnospiraceae bacterium]|nr:glycosyltransferase family 2 protein [Lachnospiraceae bacterium]
MDNLYLVMPAYNEAENIEDVVNAWYPLLEGKGEGSRLVVADSGSTDNTHKILKRLMDSYPKLEVLSDTGKQHGPKLMALYGYAIDKGADYIFQTDSDGQTNPDEFNKFWKMRVKYDAVIGKRPSRGDGKFRKFVEKVLCRILRVYFKVSVPDANAPFRLMKTELVSKYLKRLPDRYDLPNVMLTTYFAYFRENIKFVNISFRPRQGGVNSLNIPKIVKAGWKALHDFRLLRKDMLK